MHEPGINADDILRARDQLRHLIKWRPRGNARSRHGSGDALAACPLRLAAPGQYQFRIPAKCRPQCLAKCDPMRFRPLLFRARGCVQEHRISRSVTRKLSAIETELRSSLRRVTKREPAQNPVALDGVEFAADAMANIVKKRRQRLADA